MDSLVDPVVFPKYVPYKQRRFNLYTPHGYYLSEEINLDGRVQGVFVQCLGKMEKNTNIRLLIRIKEYGQSEFGAFKEATGLSWKTDRIITHIQYAVALNTTDGKKTPSFFDVRITPGNELVPDLYAEKTAMIQISTISTQKIIYRH